MTSPDVGYRSATTLTRDELLECQRLGLTQKESAKRLRISEPRYIGRREVELGIPRPPRQFRTPLVGEVRERARALLADGQPAPWVSETLNTSADETRTLAKSRPDHAFHILQWQVVWAQIRRNPELVKLHREFAPKGPKGRPAA